MILLDYQVAARRTKSGVFNFHGLKHEIDLIHAALGISSEAGEFSDAMKKSLYYGDMIDRAALIEELGDILYYVAMACDALDVHIATVMEANVEKLRRRYPEKFTTKAARERADKKQ